MTGDLLRQLSIQQRFILTYLLVRSRQESWPVPYQAVSKATAVELDDDGSRLARGEQPGLTSMHTSSFSRAVDSLEERGLVAAERGNGIHRPRRVAVRLTPSGQDAAEELLRRHHDGRFALEFSTLETE